MINNKNCVCVCVVLASTLMLSRIVSPAAAPGKGLQLSVRCFAFYFIVTFHRETKNYDVNVHLQKNLVPAE